MPATLSRQLPPLTPTPGLHRPRPNPKRAAAPHAHTLSPRIMNITSNLSSHPKGGKLLLRTGVRDGALNEDPSPRHVPGLLERNGTAVVGRALRSVAHIVSFMAGST